MCPPCGEDTPPPGRRGATHPNRECWRVLRAAERSPHHLQPLSHQPSWSVSLRVWAETHIRSFFFIFFFMALAKPLLEYRCLTWGLLSALTWMRHERSHSNSCRHLLVLPLVMSIRDHRQQNQFNNNGCLC